MNGFLTSGSNSINKISSANSRSAATLVANAVFQGIGEDVSRYGRAGISISSSNEVRGTLTVEVSHDGVSYSGPSRQWVDTRFAQPHMWNIVERFFRIKYTNGSIAALDLTIQVQYSNNANILLSHQLDEKLLDETEAIITRSVIAGKDQAGGGYRNVDVDATGKLKIKDLPVFELLKEMLEENKKQTEYLKFISGNHPVEK